MAICRAAQRRNAAADHERRLQSDLLPCFGTKLSMICAKEDVSQAQEAKQLRDENTKLRKLVADLSLDKEALQSVIRKNGSVSSGLAHPSRPRRPCEEAARLITNDLLGSFRKISL
jgi:hypothetical protein